MGYAKHIEPCHKDEFGIVVCTFCDVAIEHMDCLCSIRLKDKGEIPYE